MMSEEVRRRLAAGDDDQPSILGQPGPAPVESNISVEPTTRPQRSNLGRRLRTNMHMQVCYINNQDEQTEDSDDDSDLLEASCSSAQAQMSKSTSTPAINRNTLDTHHQLSNRGSLTTSRDSTKSASELRKAKAEQEPIDSDRLENEAREMLVKAKATAHLQMELEKQTVQPVTSPIEHIVGVPLNRKLTRAQLTKMGVTQLQLIVNDLHTKIESFNEQLVKYLMERDSLHMEQDSMLVDVEDMLQHRRHTEIVLPEFLVSASTSSSSALGGMQRRLRVFKR